MIMTIFHHDVETTEAVIRFEHNDVTYMDVFKLNLVIPGTIPMLAQLGVEFTEEMQLRVADQLCERVQEGIENGSIKNPPVRPQENVNGPTGDRTDQPQSG